MRDVDREERVVRRRDREDQADDEDGDEQPAQAQGEIGRRLAAARARRERGAGQGGVGARGHAVRSERGRASLPGRRTAPRERTDRVLSLAAQDLVEVGAGRRRLAFVTGFSVWVLGRIYAVLQERSRRPVPPKAACSDQRWSSAATWVPFSMPSSWPFETFQPMVKILPVLPTSSIALFGVLGADVDVLDELDVRVAPR